MIIYKSCGSDRALYDTNRPDWVEHNVAPSAQFAPLQHHTNGMLVRDYLLQYYPPSHEIFTQFGEAYFHKHEIQHFHFSLFTYNAEKVAYNEKVQQDHSVPTGEYDDDGNEIEEYMYWCYRRIVFARNEKEAEEKYIKHIVDTAILPDHYDVSEGVDEPEDCQDEDDEDGYSLIVVK